MFVVSLFLVMPDGTLRTINAQKGEHIFIFTIRPYLLKHGMFVAEFSYARLTKWDVRENFDEVSVILFCHELIVSTYMFLCRLFE